MFDPFYLDELGRILKCWSFSIVFIQPVLAETIENDDVEQVPQISLTRPIRVEVLSHRDRMKSAFPFMKESFEAVR